MGVIGELTFSGLNELGPKKECKMSDDDRGILVRIVSPTLAEKAMVKVGSVHEAWKLDTSGENSWMDDDGKQYAYEVLVFDHVEPGDPPVGWYAHADEVEIVDASSCEGGEHDWESKYEGNNAEHVCGRCGVRYVWIDGVLQD